MLFNSSVVGQEELDARSVNVRNRDDVGTKARSETIPLDEIVQKLVALKDRRNLQNKEAMTGYQAAEDNYAIKILTA